MRRADATAVVVTHNSERQIVAALTALRQAQLPVRLVDNASTDATVDLVRRRFPEVTVLVSTTNTGFATAVNRAAAGVDTDVVLLVNPDCVVAPNTVAELVRVIRSRPSVGIVGPRLVDAQGRIAISAHRFESSPRCWPVGSAGRWYRSGCVGCSVAGSAARPTTLA
ncbi:hypothetical protein GCM10027614_04710 [Micromonospora vulcania]